MTLILRRCCRRILVTSLSSRNFERQKVYDCIVRKDPNTFSNHVKYFAFLQRKTLTWAEVKEWYKWNKMETMRKDQKFLPKRHRILGPDLATAHFFVFRGAKIKFLHREDWLSKKHVKTKEIPSVHNPYYIVEALDASGTGLLYEGFDNLVFLRCLKKLLLRNCPYIDDFCLHRMYIVADTLEHLDISGCENVTERGIATLHRLRNLKKLVIHNTKRIANKELVCLMLQELLPNLEIEGVDYKNPALLKRLKKYMDDKYLPPPSIC